MLKLIFSVVTWLWLFSGRIWINCVSGTNQLLLLTALHNSERLVAPLVSQSGSVCWDREENEQNILLRLYQEWDLGWYLCLRFVRETSLIYYPGYHIIFCTAPSYDGPRQINIKGRIHLICLRKSLDCKSKDHKLGPDFFPGEWLEANP